MKNKKITRHTLMAALAAVAFVFYPADIASAQNVKMTEKPYTYVEQMPEFKGGEAEMLRFLGTNIKYPVTAVNNGLEGLVVISFVVETDGRISEVNTVKPLSQETDAEAVRVVKLMNGQWLPGRQKGEAVRVRYTLPVRFALRESDRAAAADRANRMPVFKGGAEAMQQAMQTYLALPAEARKENLNARVLVKFYVDREGQVSNVRLEGTKLKKMVGPGSELDYMDASTFQLQNKAVLAKLSESAMAAVKATSGQWEPALQKGQRADAEVVLPVQFISSASGKGSEKMGAPTLTKYIKQYYKADEVDVKPTFKEGSFEKYLARNLRYPASAAFEGTVTVTFLIKPDGKVITTIPTSVGQELRETISSTIQKTNGQWNPGKVDGRAVHVNQTITILFVTGKDANKQDVEKADVVVTR